MYLENWFFVLKDGSSLRDQLYIPDCLFEKNLDLSCTYGNNIWIVGEIHCASKDESSLVTLPVYRMVLDEEYFSFVSQTGFFPAFSAGVVAIETEEGYGWQVDHAHEDYVDLEVLAVAGGISKSELDMINRSLMRDLKGLGSTLVPTYFRWKLNNLCLSLPDIPLFRDPYWMPEFPAELIDTNV